MPTAVLMISLLYQTYPNCPVGIDEFSQAPIDPKQGAQKLFKKIVLVSSKPSLNINF